MAASFDRYTISWEDWQGRSCVLSIYDTQVQHSDVTVLAPGSRPFVTKRDDDEGAFVPVRNGAGIITVIDTYSVLDNFDMSSSLRYRVVLTVGGTVRWLGWLKSESLTQVYSGVDREFSLEAVDDVQAMKEFDMSSSDLTLSIGGEPFEWEGGMGPVMLSKVLTECFARVENLIGPDIHDFVFPINSSQKLWELKARVMRQLWFEDGSVNEDDEESWPLNPMNCYDVVSAICESFGWTLQQVGTRFYFTNVRGHKMNGGSELVAYTSPKSFYQLYSLTDNTGESGVLVGDASGADSYGQHEISLYPGRHRICVSAKQTSYDSLLESLESQLVPLADEGTQTRGGRKCRCISYRLRSRRNVDIYDYDIQAVWGQEPTVAPRLHSPRLYFSAQEPAIGSDNLQPDGCVLTGVCKEDTYVENSSKINYEFKTGLAVNMWFPWRHYTDSRPQPNEIQWPTDIQRRMMPLIELRGRSVCYTEGALVLNISSDSMQSDTEVKFAANNSQIYATGITPKFWVVVRVGKYVWVRDDDSEYGGYWDKNDYPDLAYNPDWENGRTKLKNTKTLAMEYNGADGLVMPLTRGVSGQVIVQICVPMIERWATWARFLLHSIRLEYMAKDDDLYYGTKQSEYLYMKYIAGQSGKLEEVKALLHSQRNGQQSAGMLLQPRGNGDLEPIRAVSTQSGSLGGRPEEMLLQRLVEVYRVPQREVLLTLQQNDTMLPVNVWEDPTGVVWCVLSETEVDWMSGGAQYLMIALS